MAVIKKKELSTLSIEEIHKKLAEIKKAMLESEDRKDKMRPLKKAIAKLLTREKILKDQKSK